MSNVKSPFYKVKEREEVQTYFQDGMTLMVGGFGGVGTPPTLIDTLLESNTQNIHYIGNDTGFPWIGIGKVVCNGQIKSMITSHIGSNPTAGDLMNERKLQVEFSPQGILIERIRAGGSGIPAFLSEVGSGTLLEYDKQRVTLNGVSYLVETALRGDVALVYAKKADTFGNLIFDKTARNTNPYIAMACDITIVEAEEIVEEGELNPEEIVVPGVFVNAVVQSKGVNWQWVWEK